VLRRALLLEQAIAAVFELTVFAKTALLPTCAR